MAPSNANLYLVGTTVLRQVTRYLVVRLEPFCMGYAQINAFFVYSFKIE